MERLHILGKVYSGVTNGPKHGNFNESSRSARSAHPMRRGLGGVSWPEWELRSVIFFIFSEFAAILRGEMDFGRYMRFPADKRHAQEADFSF